MKLLQNYLRLSNCYKKLTKNIIILYSCEGLWGSRVLWGLLILCTCLHYPGPKKQNKIIAKYQISAKQGPYSRFVIEANTKSLWLKLSQTRIVKLMDQGRVTRSRVKYCETILDYEVTAFICNIYSYFFEEELWKCTDQINVRLRVSCWKLVFKFL